MRAMLVAAVIATLSAGCVRVPVQRAEPGSTVSVSDSVLKREIQGLLDHGAAAWNRGDLEGFLSDYLPGHRTSFVTSRGVLHGVPAIRASYESRYFAPGARRDSLSFEGLEVDQLSPGVANAIAFYVLSRGDSVTARGPTSLVLVRVGARWYIVHDHSS